MPILSPCRCNIVHTAIFTFDNNIAICRKSSRRAVSALRDADNSLRFLLFDGDSSVLRKASEALDRGGKESMSCPRFLYRAWHSIRNAKDLSPELENYWGSYLLVTSKLLAPRSKKSYATPKELIALKEETVDSIKEDIEPLSRITESIKQILTTGSQTYKHWLIVRKVMGRNAVKRLFDAVANLTSHEDYKRHPLLTNAAVNSVYIWAALERLYFKEVQRYKELGEPCPKKTLGLLESEVFDLLDQVKTIMIFVDVHARHKDAYTAVEGAFFDAESQLPQLNEMIAHSEQSSNPEVGF